MEIKGMEMKGNVIKGKKRKGKERKGKKRKGKERKGNKRKRKERNGKETKEKKWFRFYKRSMYQNSLFVQDKDKIIEKYQEIACRDAKIILDTIYDFDDKTININITIDEGSQYYIRDVEWSGNQKYSTGLLDTILGIKKGDLYDQRTLDAKLFMNPNGSDISSLYMDDGYLFFQVTPVEKKLKMIQLT